MTSSEEHERILGEIKQLQKDLEFHIAEAHAGLMEAAEIIERDDAIAKQLEEFAQVTGKQLAQLNIHMEDLARIILGEKTLNFDGQVIRVDGLAQNVDELKVLTKNLTDQRSRVRLSKGQFYGLLGTIVTTLGGIVVALIQLG